MDVPNQSSPKRGRSWLVLLTLVLVFAIPIIAAYWFFSQSAMQSLHTTNHGVLLRKPLHISELKLKDEDGDLLHNQRPKQLTRHSLRDSTNGKWLLLLVNPESCHQLCRQRLYTIHQIRVATGKNSDRVQNAVLTYANNNNDGYLDGLLSKRYPDIRHLMVDSQQYKRVVQQKVTQVNALQSGTLFVVDPVGNVVMVYKPKVPADGVLKDLERLLKVSQIG